MAIASVIKTLTSSSVRALSDIMAPSCIDCPFARQFVSVDRSMERDDIRVKISVRCDKMVVIGPACPDGGQPSGVYLKDLGVPRKLGEQQIKSVFRIDRFEIDEASFDIESMLKAPDYINHIKFAFEEQAHERDAVLHEMNETLNFMIPGETLSEPIKWLGGEPDFDTFNKARDCYIENHVIPYRENMDHTLLCDPTPYMEKYFPKEYIRPFGVMTDHIAGRAETRDSFDGVAFLGDAPPSQPTTYEPPPTQDELYEDWGNFA